uniref:MOSC domain-containing protein n=1 Tax=Kalanchoe fedtschenkoi TaxID=63787 RepID=A0A7N0V6Q5_KALFE
MSRYALSQGSAACAIDIEESWNNAEASGNGASVSSYKVMQRPVQRRERSTCCEKENGNSFNLFALPSECNFSGVRFNLDLVKQLKGDFGSIFEGSTFSRGHWMLLVDAAKGCVTEPPDLSRHPADFTVISFYKLFGYPTGLGALIVRNEAAKILKKTYFSGGTVAASIADIDFVKRREAFEESFEDGTVSFLSIASIKHGFKILNTLTSRAISRHIASLSAYTRNTLRTLRHENGAVVCTLYGIRISEVPRQLGSVVTFNLTRSDGSWVGYREVEKLASLSGIQLRTGCFCNPGACAKYLGLSHLDLLSNVEAGHVCWDDNDIVNGKPTGAIRVSFGYMSTYEDAKEFIDFIVKSFLSSSSYNSGNGSLSRKNYASSPSDGYCFSYSGIEGHPTSGPLLKSIYVYPIKSCAGFNVEKWPLCDSGLLYDREWILRGVSGDILTQKKVPEMRLIRNTIDLIMKILVAESPRCKVKLWLDLESDTNYCGKEYLSLNNQRLEVHVYDDEVNQWFSCAIGRPCTLLRLASPGYKSCLSNFTSQHMCRDVGAKLNFVNEAQFLLINEESVCDLNRRIKANEQKGLLRADIQVNPMRFRPNLVISAGEYTEDEWRSLTIGNSKFTSLGGCNRCQMINLDDERDQILKLKEPLSTLATYRRIKGKILFGILLRYEGCVKEGQDGTHAWLQVGQEINPRCE